MSTLREFYGGYSPVKVSNDNMIINGDMRIAQRGTTLTGSGYHIDRFRSNGSNQTAARYYSSAYDTSTQHALKVVKTVASGEAQTITTVELPVAGYAGVFKIGQSVTFSIKIQSDNNLTGFKVTTSFSDGAVYGNAVDLPNLIDATAYDSADGWVTLTGTMTIDDAPVSTNTVFRVNISSGTIAVNEHIKFGDVKLELGEQATPFVPRHYAEELALCQRYFLAVGRFYGHRIGVTNASTSDLSSGQVCYPVEMRIAPTALVSWDSLVLYGTHTSSYITNKYMRCYGASNQTASAYRYNAGQQLDAEL